MLLITHGDYVKGYLYVCIIYTRMCKNETHCAFDSCPNLLGKNDEGGEMA